MPAVSHPSPLTTTIKPTLFITVNIAVKFIINIKLIL